VWVFHDPNYVPKKDLGDFQVGTGPWNFLLGKEE
jgi:hypothetical protein